MDRNFYAEFWHDLIPAMFDVTAWYWNLLWGGFITMGGCVSYIFVVNGSRK